MEQALVDFTNVIRALDQRISQLEQQFQSFSIASQPKPEESIQVPEVGPTQELCVTQSETVAETQPESVPAPSINPEVNLDDYSPDTIQNELWRTFKAISDANLEVVVKYSGDYPRNVIVYATEETQPVYHNAGAAEMRIIQAIEGTLIATLQAGESCKTARVDGVWTKIE